MSLREAKQLVVAELRDIDTETVGVVSAFALDETVKSQSSGYSLVLMDKTVNFETTLRNARQLSAAELRDIDIEEVSIVRTAYFDKIRT